MLTALWTGTGVGASDADSIGLVWMVMVFTNSGWFGSVGSPRFCILSPPCTRRCVLTANEIRRCSARNYCSQPSITRISLILERNTTHVAYRARFTGFDKEGEEPASEQYFIDDIWNFCDPFLKVCDDLDVLLTENAWLWCSASTALMSQGLLAKTVGTRTGAAEDPHQSGDFVDRHFTRNALKRCAQQLHLGYPQGSAQAVFSGVI
jgi:hypothetical protein